MNCLKISSVFKNDLKGFFKIIIFYIITDLRLLLLKVLNIYILSIIYLVIYLSKTVYAPRASILALNWYIYLGLISAPTYFLFWGLDLWSLKLCGVSSNAPEKLQKSECKLGQCWPKTMSNICINMTLKLVVNMPTMITYI